MFLEECNYVAKEKMILKYLIDDIEISSDSDGKNSDEESSDKETSDEESSDEETSDEKILIKKFLMKKTKNKKTDKTLFKSFFLYIKMTKKQTQVLKRST